MVSIPGARRDLRQEIAEIRCAAEVDKAEEASSKELPSLGVGEGCLSLLDITVWEELPVRSDELRKL